MIVLLTIITQRPSMAFMIKPELLAPAGNMEKAMIAFAYGADAIFVEAPCLG